MIEEVNADKSDSKQQLLSTYSKKHKQTYAPHTQTLNNSSRDTCIATRQQQQLPPQRHTFYQSSTRRFHLSKQSRHCSKCQQHDKLNTFPLLLLLINQSYAWILAALTTQLHMSALGHRLYNRLFLRSRLPSPFDVSRRRPSPLHSHLYQSHYGSGSVIKCTMSTYTPPTPSLSTTQAATNSATDQYYPTYTAALIQLNCQADMQHNLHQATQLIRQAASAGAKLICTPENTTRLTALTLPFDIQKDGRYESNHPIIPEYRRLAAELNVWLAIGSVSVRAEDDVNKMANRSLLISPHTSPDQPSLGTVVARYDKCHMFDAPTLSDAANDSYLESARIRPGRSVPTVLTPFGPIALTVCYDLRFPVLYSRLATVWGVGLVLVPSAFTVMTGEAHWEVLVRARAIECGCYVLAAAQCGEHTGGRKTYGRSMAVGPWGEVVGVREEGTEGVLLVEIDRRKVDEARKRIPSLSNQREFELTLTDATNATAKDHSKSEQREEKSSTAATSAS